MSQESKSQVQPLSARAYLLLSCLLLQLTGLIGCAGRTSEVTDGLALRTVVHVNGSVRGGQQPVAGATIQLYAVNATVDGGQSTPLLQTPVVTDSNGGFSITNLYSCAGSSLVYLLASGGNPGVGAPNQNLTLMTALGTCSSLTATTTIAVNELTTVAAVNALAPFISGSTFVGAQAINASSLEADFALASQLVSASTGTAPGIGIPAGLAVPTSLLYSLADIIAPCINSTGGRAGDSTPCGQLFQLATVSGLPAPTDTIGALISIAKNPTMNAGPLFGLLQGTAPFQPTLSAAPDSWAVSINLPMPERANLLGEYLLNEGAGAVADDTSGQAADGTIIGSPNWLSTQGIDQRTNGQHIELPPSVNAMQTWQVAAYTPAYATNISSIGSAPIYPGYVGPAVLLCGTSGRLACFWGNSFYSGTSQRFFAVTTDHTESNQFLSSGWHVVTVVCGSSANLAHIYYDGAEVNGYVTQGNNTCPVSANGNFELGGSSLFNSSFTGRIAGAWLWSTALNTSEVQIAASVAQNFLAAKGIMTTFSPVQAAQPVVMVGVDSRTAGVGYGITPQTVWPAAMQLNLANYTLYNVALAGQTVFDEVNEFDLLYRLEAQPNTVPEYTILWGGVNDFNFQTPQQTADNLHLLVTKAKAIGARVVLATEISASGKDTQKDVLDTILRANAFSWGVDNVADLATDPVLGADGAFANQNFFADGLHPTGTAEPHVTTIMQNAVNELLGSTAANPTTVSAAAYQELAGDDYVMLTGSSAQVVTLPDCTGYSLPRQILASAGQATIVPVAGQSLSGSSSVPPGVKALITPVPGPLATSGCSWKRIQ